MNGRERVLAMIEGRPTDRLPLMPITMMFGSSRLGVPYREYASCHRTLADVQLRTAETFGFDHVSTVSDPAREASDLGAKVEWFDNQPPAIVESEALLGEKAMLARLALPDPACGRMGDRVSGIRLLKERSAGQLLVEGWVEGPCAMAADLRGLNTLMLDFYDDPDFVVDLFEYVVEMELRFARAQLDAGADIIGVGDAAASLIGPRFYSEYVLPYERKLVDGIHAMGGRVRLHICGNTRKLVNGMGSLKAEIVDLDFLTPLDEARAAMEASQVLLGNLDPVRVLRDGTPASVEEALDQCHRQAGPRWIVAAGCEVPPGTPDANVHAMARYAFSHTA
ncbi:MAG: uroporphyrinogen decarboxylase family protein [Bryobacteraceae bacterium]